MKPEEWKDVAGYEGIYLVSSYGRIKSLSRKQTAYGGREWVRPEKILKTTFDGRYFVISLAREGKRVRYYVHVLVLEAFVGSRPDGYHACHCDGDSRNNSLTNLRWDSARENVLDKSRHGTMPIGTRHHLNKYSEEQIRKVKRLILLGKRITEISGLTGVPVTTVSAVKQGRQWAHLSVEK